MITTTSFRDVAEQLQGLGLTAGQDFAVSPILNDLRIIEELEDARARLLFSSGAVPREDPHFGGGIYEFELDGGQHSYRKMYSGYCHGMLPWDGGLIAVDDRRGLLRLDRQFKILKEAPFPSATRAHGIAWAARTERFYVVATILDQVLVFDKDFKYLDSIAISNKMAAEGSAQHHCNDVCVIGGSLFVSMFSITGNWKRDVFDGVVLEIDLETGQRVGTPITNLWMPHNVELIDGSLTVLDSLRGELKKNNAQPVGRFPGFMRGLAFDSQFYYLGQSRNRNYSKYLGLSLNVSIDTAIIVFDEHTKVSRSLSLPSKISEVHCIRLWNS